MHTHIYQVSQAITDFCLSVRDCLNHQQFVVGYNVAISENLFVKVLIANASCKYFNYLSPCVLPLG